MTLILSRSGVFKFMALRDGLGSFHWSSILRLSLALKHLARLGYYEIHIFVCFGRQPVLIPEVKSSVDFHDGY